MRVSFEVAVLRDDGADEIFRDEAGCRGLLAFAQRLSLIGREVVELDSEEASAIYAIAVGADAEGCVFVDLDDRAFDGHGLATIFGVVDGAHDHSVHVSDRDEGGVGPKVVVEGLDREWHGGDGLLDLSATKDEGAGRFVTGVRPSSRWP